MARVWLGRGMCLRETKPMIRISRLSRLVVAVLPLLAACSGGARSEDADTSDSALTRPTFARAPTISPESEAQWSRVLGAYTYSNANCTITFSKVKAADAR
jgi:hypothetical protein